MPYERTSGFIGMLLHFRYFADVIGEQSGIPVMRRKPTKDESEEFREVVGNDKELKNKLGLLTDEGAYIKEVRFLPDGTKWYTLEQRYYKGMSNSPTWHWSTVEPTLDEKFRGIYNLLFDLEIYSERRLREIYVNKLKEYMKEE